MQALPHDWLMLAALAGMLGIRHGLDADHLLTIDGLTRYNAVTAPRLARLCGTLFSLGHGVVVIAVAVSAGFAATRWQLPGWLEQTGAWISISFLIVLGLVNLDAVMRTPRHQVVRTAGLKGRWFARLQATRNPWLIACIGALFALSFDTVSQAAVFAMAAAQFGGVLPGATLAVCFVLGMVLADGLNGVWIARLIRRADHTSRIASRVFGTLIAVLSLAAGAFGVTRLLSSGADAWVERHDIASWLGPALIVIIAGAFVLAMRWPQRYAARTGAE